jgi:hypothetical protein
LELNPSQKQKPVKMLLHLSISSSYNTLLNI